MSLSYANVNRNVESVLYIIDLLTSGVVPLYTHVIMTIFIPDLRSRCRLSPSSSSGVSSSHSPSPFLCTCHTPAAIWILYLGVCVCVRVRVCVVYACVRACLVHFAHGLFTSPLLGCFQERERSSADCPQQWLSSADKECHTLRQRLFLPNRQ